MFTHPDQIGQLVREHQRQMLAEASQRQRRRPHVDPAARTPNAAAIFRRLATALSRAVVVAAEGPRAIWPARPHSLGEPAAAQGRRAGRSN